MSNVLGVIPGDTFVHLVHLGVQRFRLMPFHYSTPEMKSNSTSQSEAQSPVVSGAPQRTSLGYMVRSL